MFDDLGRRVTASLGRVPQMSSKVAVFVSRSGYYATVNLGESTVALPFVGLSLPPAGHPVQVELRGRQLVVTGPARPLPGIGTITATGSPRATVTAWGISYTLRYRSSYTPVLSDEVEISWLGDEGTIQGKVTATSNVVAPATIDPASTLTYHPEPFTATDSGSYASGWAQRDVWASDSYLGAWFYGSKVKDTIPDAAVIKDAQLYLNPRQIQGAAPNLQLHTSASKPSGAVTFTGTASPLSVKSGWVPVPLAFIDFLKANDGGIGFNHGGYNIYRGTQADQLSGALDITWEA